jgi:uncharacterized membrane protein (DUF373 family)
MNYIRKNSFFDQAAKGADVVVSILIFATIVGLVFYLFRIVVDLFASLQFLDVNRVLYSVAIVIILVKVYRILLFYMNTHHVSIKYIVEIAIIAPAIELIFVPEGRSELLNIIYAVFSLCSLLIYVMYFRKLCDADETDIRDEEKLERQKAHVTQDILL